MFGLNILIFNLLGPQPLPPPHSLPHSNHSNGQDWQVVDSVISLLSDPSVVINEAVAIQGSKMIKTLSAISCNLRPYPYVSTSGAMKLAIPYFGTISIARGSKFHQHPHPTPPWDATAKPPLQQLQKHNLEWNLVYPAATSRIPTAPVTLPRTPPSSTTSNLSDHTYMQNENRINNFVPANGQAFYIEFSPSCSLASSYIPPPATSATTATMDTNLNDFVNVQNFQLTPKNERIMMQTFYKLNQNMGENWNFSLEAMI